MDTTLRDERGIARLLAPAALTAAVLIALVVFVTGSHDAGSHKLSVTVSEATNVVSGQPVKVAGVKIGRVSGVAPAARGSAARISLELQDKAWPVARDSKMTLRWGGTASFSNRYIDLVPGRDGRHAIAENGRFPTSRFVVPLEFDGLLRTFREKTRTDITHMLNAAGPALKASKRGLAQTLGHAPPALYQGGKVLGDLDADRVALDTLVKSTDRVLGAVQSSEPGVRELLDGAGETLNAIADESGAVRAGLADAPTTLRQARTTLARANPTLVSVQRLAHDIGPGVTEVRRIARPVSSVLRTVRTVGPDAAATLRSVRQAVPDLNPLLARVGELSPEIRSIGGNAVKSLSCIRPYTPDALAFFTNWGDFLSTTDGKDRLIRAQVQNYGPAFSNASPYNAAQMKALFPNIEYGFPRPPGTNAGQPWFLPKCGAGPDALDPTKDPEARTG